MRKGSLPGRWWGWIAPPCGPISTRRAHATAQGAPHLRRPRWPPLKKGEGLLATEALGRSRGGLTTKLHVAGDGRGRLLAVHVTEGQRHDSTQLEAVLDRIRVPRPRGRPRKRPDAVALDKGYSYPRCRRTLRRRKLRHVIPERRDQREQRRKKGCRGGRPPHFEAAVYAARSWVERLINQLKQFRAVATRYDKRAENYLGMVLIAGIKLWLKQ